MRMLRVGGPDGVELCVDEYGDPGDPLVLLVHGAAASMDWWDVGLCEALAAGGRRVVRYDHRDTGRSTTGTPGSPAYDAGAWSATAPTWSSPWARRPTWSGCRWAAGSPSPWRCGGPSWSPR